MGAVKNALQRDWLNPNIMDLDPEKSILSQVNMDACIVDDGLPLGDYHRVSRVPNMTSWNHFYSLPLPNQLTITTSNICKVCQDAQSGKCGL